MSEAREWNHKKQIYTQRGWQVSNILSIKICELPKLGEIITTSLETTECTVHGLRFSNSKDDSHLMAARKKAIANAFDKARAFAEASSLTLGVPLTITEVPDQSRPYGKLSAQCELAGAGAAPIAEGEENYVAQVQITFSVLSQCDKMADDGTAED